MRALAIAALLTLGSCQEPANINPCGGVTGCLSTRHGVVLGGDPADRAAAKRELQSAATTYAAWLDGKAASPGLIILDRSAKHNARFVQGTAWTLIFDRSVAAGRGSDGLAVGRQDVKPRESIANGEPFALNLAGGEFDIARPGILAHEICHKHGSRVFEQTWGGSRTFPDMLDEVVAISCESEELKSERVGQFAGQFAKGATIPWQEFLVTKHPFKDGEAMKVLSRLAKAGRGAVTFDIRPGSPYEAKIGIFYSQAAAFGVFVSTRSCKGMQPLGELLSTYDPRDGLDQWLRSKGAQFCLPSSVDAFEKSFSDYIIQWKRKQSH